MVTVSSLKEPGGPSTTVVGQIRADDRTHVEPRHVAETRTTERAEPRSRDSRGNHHDFCRRCSN